MNNLENGKIIIKDQYHYGIFVSGKMIRTKPILMWRKKLTQRDLNKDFSSTPKVDFDSPNLSKEMKELVIEGEKEANKGITVKKLIERLSKLDPNLPVCVLDQADDDDKEEDLLKMDNGYGSMLDYTVWQIENMWVDKGRYCGEDGEMKEGEFLAIYF